MEDLELLGNILQFVSKSVESEENKLFSPLVFSLTLVLLFAKLFFHFVVSKFKFYHFVQCYSMYLYIT